MLSAVLGEEDAAVVVAAILQRGEGDQEPGRLPAKLNREGEGRSLLGRAGNHGVAAGRTRHRAKTGVGAHQPLVCPDVWCFVEVRWLNGPVTQSRVRAGDQIAEGSL